MPTISSTRLPEEYLTVKELATEWKVSTDTVRRHCADEPGVIVISNFRSERERQSTMSKRKNAAYQHMYVPESDMRVALQATAYINSKLCDAYTKIENSMAGLGNEEWDMSNPFATRVLGKVTNLLDEVAVLKSCLARLAIWMECPGHMPRKFFREWTKRS
jgi:hypothetical protein